MDTVEEADIEGLLAAAGELENGNTLTAEDVHYFNTEQLLPIATFSGKPLRA